MPALYADHHVARRLARLLRHRGHAVVTVRQLGLDRAIDATHLLTGATRGAILLTHNERDFVLLLAARCLVPLGP